MATTSAHSHISTSTHSKTPATNTARKAIKPLRIFLVGMMGSGKSFWADKLKRKFKVPAYDLDALIEMMEEKSVAEIFSEDGEDYFRKAEAKMLRLFGEKKQFILACGGGTATYHDNIEWMNKQGITIWLDEPVEVLSQRLVNTQSRRPLLKNISNENIPGFLNTKLEERQPYFSKAKYRLSGEQLAENTFAKLIKENA